MNTKKCIQRAYLFAICCKGFVNIDKWKSLEKDEANCSWPELKKTTYRKVKVLLNNAYSTPVPSRDDSAFC